MCCLQVLRKVCITVPECLVILETIGSQAGRMTCMQAGCSALAKWWPLLPCPSTVELWPCLRSNQQGSLPRVRQAVGAITGRCSIHS